MFIVYHYDHTCAMKVESSHTSAAHAEKVYSNIQEPGTKFLIDKMGEVLLKDVIKKAA